MIEREGPAADEAVGPFCMKEQGMAIKAVVIMAQEANTSVGPLRRGWSGGLERDEAERLMRIRAALPADGHADDCPGLTPLERERVKRDYRATLGASAAVVHEEEEEFEVAPSDEVNRPQRVARADRMARGAVSR